MGQDDHNCGSRVIVVGFSDLGFDVDVGLLFSTPGKVDDLAADSDVHIIGVLSQADIPFSLLPAFRDELRMRSTRRSTRGRGYEKGFFQKKKGKRRMMIRWWWGGDHISTWDHAFLLRRRKNDDGKECRCCEAIFGTGNRITTAAIKVLCLIREKRGGGIR